MSWKLAAFVLLAAAYIAVAVMWASKHDVLSAVFGVTGALWLVAAIGEYEARRRRT